MAYQLGWLSNSSSGPSLGVHSGDYHTVGAGSNPLTTPARNTQASGSSLLIFSAFYLTEFGSLVHNKTGTISDVSSLAYTAWAPYGGKFSWVQTLTGGAGQTVSHSNSALYAGDEKTLFMVEVMNGQTLISPSPQELPASGASVVTSNSVTTTGPAVVVCCCWGDANVNTPMNMTVHADSVAEGWAQIEDITIDGAAHIQGAVAARQVTGAGTYSCKWDFNPSQRALFFTVAVQS